MRKIPLWAYSFLCAVALGSVTAMLSITTTAARAESQIISPLDDEFNTMLLMPDDFNVFDTVTIPEVVACALESEAQKIAAAFQKYGTRLRFSVANEAVRSYRPRCAHATDYPLATGTIPYEPETFAQLNRHKKAFVVFTGIEYLVVARPEVFDAVFRSCKIPLVRIDAAVESEQPSSCWRDL